MANSSGDVYEDITKLYKMIEDLASAARVPNISVAGAKLAFSQNVDAAGVPGVRTPTGWGDLDPPGGGGYPVAPACDLIAPASGRCAIFWGVLASVSTTTAGGNNERAGMGVDVVSGGGFGALAHSTALDNPAMLQVDQASEYLKASIMGFKVASGAIPGQEFHLSTRFYRHNSASLGVEFIGPWIAVLPL